MVVLAFHPEILVRFFLWQVHISVLCLEIFFLTFWFLQETLYTNSKCICREIIGLSPLATGASLLVYQLFIYSWVNKFLGPLISSRIASVSCRLLFLISKVYFIMITHIFNNHAVFIHTCPCYVPLYDIPVWRKTFFRSLFGSYDEECSRSKNSDSFHFFPYIQFLHFKN